MHEPKEEIRSSGFEAPKTSNSRSSRSFRPPLTKNSELRTQNFSALPAWGGVNRGVLSLSSPSLERGDTLGKGPSVGLLHLGHDIFECFGHQACEGKIFRPVDCVSETLNEMRRQRDRNPLVL